MCVCVCRSGDVYKWIEGKREGWRVEGGGGGGGVRRVMLTRTITIRVRKKGGGGLCGD